MKIKDGFVLRKVAGTFAVIPMGKTSVDFNGMITLNEVGAFLWKCLEKECTKDDLVKAVLNEYEVDEERALSDIEKFLNKVKEENFIEE